MRLERRQQLRRDQFLAVQWSGLWTGALIQPMVGQLRCHKPHHGEKKITGRISEIEECEEEDKSDPINKKSKTS